MSVKAFQQPSSTLLETATELDQELRDWRNSLTPSMRPGDRLKSFQIPRDSRYLQTVLMHYVYYGSLMAIHTIFAYPWVYSTIFGDNRGTVTQDQIIYSSNTIADAARNIIVITRSLDITGASIQWYVHSISGSAHFNNDQADLLLPDDRTNQSFHSHNQISDVVIYTI